MNLSMLEESKNKKDITRTLFFNQSDIVNSEQFFKISRNQLNNSSKHDTL